MNIANNDFINNLAKHWRNVMKSTDLFKWAGTITLLCSTALNGQNIYPEGPLVGIAGGLFWAIAAIKMKDPALILTNVITTTIAISSISIKYFNIMYYL